MCSCGQYCYEISQTRDCETWQKTFSKQTKSQIPIDVDGHDSKGLTENPDKTITVPSSRDLVVPSNEK